jgi:hypothetical protein
VKKSLLAVVCVIAFFGLVLPPLLQPMSPTSKSTLQSTQQNPSSSTSQLTPEATPQTKQGTTQPEPSQNPPESASQNPSQSLPQTTPEPTPPSVVQSTNRTLEEAVGNAISYVARTQEPLCLLMLNVMYRRFGITEFANSLQRFDEELSNNPENARVLLLFRRMADYSNDVPPDFFFAVTEDVDQITIPALYSDRRNLPDDYMSKLDHAANSGGYLTTHALLATIWLQENHCELPISNDFAESLYYANTRIVGNGSVVNDLQIEAAAFLYLAGQGRRVDDAFVQRVIATQNYDGGWSALNDTPSFWHTSVLGLMLLLHVEFPAASYPPMLATATSYDSMCLNPLVVCSVAVLLFEARKVKLKAFVAKYQ